MKTGALALCLLLLLPASAWARGAGGAMERLRDPLSGFDPFEQPVTAERYFPDETEKRVRRVLIDALTRRTEGFREHVRYFEEREGHADGGLAHLVRDLHDGNLTDREAYRDAQRRALAEAPSDSRQRVVRARLRRDELERADSLMAESRVGRWNALLNRLLGPVDLVKLASGSYVTAAVDTAFAELRRARAPHMPAARRKALVLYKRFLERFPDDPRRAEVERKIADLEADRKGAWVHSRLARAGEALERGKVGEAEFHAYLAAVADPEAEDVEQRFEEIDAAREARDQARRRNLSVADADSLADATPEQKRDLRGLLYALAKGDAAGTGERARDMGRRYAHEPLGTLARDAEAVALELRGRREAAKEVLNEIANAAPSPRLRQRARTLLDSPEYNLLGALDRARTGYHLKQLRFVLLGEDFLEKNAMVGAAPVITHGVAGAATLGAANVLMVSANVLEMLSGNPVSNQAVIDAAARYVRVRPDSGKSGDVYQVLGEAYESRGHLHKALYYYRLSGKVPSEEVRALEERAGRALLDAAEGTGSRERRRTLYRALLEHYPDTAAGEQAKGRLARLVSAKGRGFRLSKRFLTDHPRLHGPQGLGLKAALFDGSLDNLELADTGLNVLGRHTVMLHYDTPWGPQSRAYPIARTRVEGLEALLRERHYERAAMDVDERDQDSVGGFPEFPARLMRPETAGRGREAADREFIRRTGRAAEPRPRILDYQLLSEKESDPQRAYGLPTLQGGVTASGGVNVRADAPGSFLADELVMGNDAASPYAGARLPIPFLKGFVPVDFMVRVRPGLPSVTPQIRRPKTTVDDPHLYE